MAGYQGTEPSMGFCDIIYVGRKEGHRKIQPHDVTIFYKRKSGRGEFEVQGGIEFDSTRSYGKHTITVVAARGYTFDIIRNSEGEFQFTNSDKIWAEKKERVYL